jgi:hypothetical protein
MTEPRERENARVFIPGSELTEMVTGDVLQWPPAGDPRNLVTSREIAVDLNLETGERTSRWRVITATKVSYPVPAWLNGWVYTPRWRVFLGKDLTHRYFWMNRGDRIAGNLRDYTEYLERNFRGRTWPYPLPLYREEDGQLVDIEVTELQQQYAEYPDLRCFGLQVQGEYCHLRVWSTPLDRG